MATSRRPYLLGPLFVVLLAPPGSAADPVRWRGDYNAARKEAEDKGLPLFIEVGTADCFYCQKLDATTLKDPAVIAGLNTQFVPLRLDGNRDASIVRAMRVQLYPTVVLATADGKIHAFLQGYLAADPLRDHMRKVTALASGPKSEPPAVAAKPVPPPAPAAVDPATLAHVRTQLSQARDDYRAGHYADCLEKVSLLKDRHPNLPEAKEAAALAAQIADSPDRLTAATEQQNERSSATYLTLGESWAKRGQTDQAEGCLHVVLQLTPTGKNADAAKALLAKLRASNQALTTGYRRR